MATQPVNPAPSNKSYAAVDISTAATGLSDEVNLGGYTLSSIQMATAWTGAVLGFQGTADGSTNYQNLYGSTGNLYYHTVDASRLVILDPAIFRGISKLRLISETTAGVAVAQTAARTLKLGLSRK